MIKQRKVIGAVHSAHFHDGYPLCWPMDKDGEFLATSKDGEVTCPECKAHLGLSE